jgi:N-methylhydantoinase A/oxoprolinase/acetone carboxylase beta subunit
VSVDVGGTSCDVAVLRGAEWTYAGSRRSRRARSLPVLELESISIAAARSRRWLPVAERSPRSAGSQPSPAASVSAVRIRRSRMPRARWASSIRTFSAAASADGDAARRAIEEKRRR